MCQTTRRRIPDDMSLITNHSDNLKSHINYSAAAFYANEKYANLK
jgi:hypothetical protein